MLSSMTNSNKRWLADHLYQDIELSEPAKTSMQKAEIKSSIEKGWRDVQSSLAGEVQLNSAEALLSELKTGK